MKDKYKTKKGFTLLEFLLALIILVVVIFAALLITDKITTKAKIKGFQVTLDKMESWITEQYTMSVYTGNIINDETSLAFFSVCGPAGELCLYSKKQETQKGILLDSLAKENPKLEQFKNFVTAMGLKPENYSKILVAIDKDMEKTCVKATISKTGEFYYDGIIEDELNYYQSQSCAIEMFNQIENITDSY